MDIDEQHFIVFNMDYRHLAASNGDPREQRVDFNRSVTPRHT